MKEKFVGIAKVGEKGQIVIPKEARDMFDIKVEGAGYGIKLTQQGLFKDNLGKIQCAVCPECGYMETYIEDTNKVKKLLKK